MKNHLKLNYLIAFFMLLFFTGSSFAQTNTASKTVWHPKRINKSIELLEAGQPIYYIVAYGGYKEGKKLAKTWADYIVFNMEHKPLNFTLLHDFMKGLVDGGPTPSGHRTPTVIAILPVQGIDLTTFKGAQWLVQQALAQGVHGVQLVHARDPEAVKQFVRVSRYPIHKQAIDTLGEGLRGYGSQKFAAWVWGVSEKEYFEKADVWPLNPNGELMLGIKIEDRHALKNADKTLAVPGISFAEHGPRDMGLSYGYINNPVNPPGIPAEVDSAEHKILRLSKKHHIFFLDNVLPGTVKHQIDRGIMIGGGRQKDAAEIGRKYTHRKMPW